MIFTSTLHAVTCLLNNMNVHFQQLNAGMLLEGELEQ